MKTKYPIKDPLLSIVKKYNKQLVFEKVDDHHCHVKLKLKNKDIIETSVVDLLDMLMEAYVIGQKSKLK